MASYCSASPKVRFALFDHPDPEMAGTRYEALDMSSPHLGDTESGPHW